MQVNFTFRHVESSENVKRYARDKIAKTQKYLRAPLEADVVLSIEKHLHRVELAVRAGGERFAAQHESEDMYASLDHAVHKVERQLREAKASATTRARRAGGVAQLNGKRGPAPVPPLDSPSGPRAAPAQAAAQASAQDGAAPMREPE